MEAQSENITLLNRKSSNNQSTCLVCCNQSDIFALPPCNHKHVCWKCCLNLTQNNKFCCPFCKEDIKGKDKIVLIHVSKMSKNYNQIIEEGKIYKSKKNTIYYYASPEIAQIIQKQTSLICAVCQQSFQNQNTLKKHLNQKHRKQYCDICLANRKCILSQHVLYNQVQLNTHLKKGEYSQGQIILFHPHCDLCGITFYDIQQFRRHLDRDHWKCTICHANFQELRAVYYKDYDEIQTHFKKSHFMCQIGECLNKKLQNVFVSQAIRQEHIQKYHKKAKANKNQPVMNLLLGFNKNQEEDQLKWDHIGKNFINIFTMFEKHKGVVQKVQHYDAKIDIRQFYNTQLTKPTLSWGLDKVKKQINQKIDQFGYKPNTINLNDIRLFRPLQMQSVSKSQLDKFLHLVFDQKIADTISQNFFTKKHQFKSNYLYFQFIKKQMKYYSPFAYYYAFPQLIRFFKNQNPTKSQMDQYYYESLRQLKVGKQFIIHTKEKYSEILQFMQDLIKQETIQRIGSQISLEDYKTYLKQMNMNFYIKNQENLFFVSKDRINTLYHMIDKCKTQDFLKMNWLLKVGFSNDAYKVIQKQIYFKAQQQCFKAMKKLDTQELAFLFSYNKICLQAILDSQTFQNNKKHSAPCFLRPILVNCKQISILQIQKIIQIQNNSLKIDLHFKQSKNKGIIINEEDHPSLLQVNSNPYTKVKPPPDRDRQDFPLLAEFGGTRRPKKWNQQSSRLKNNNKTAQQQEYPSLMLSNKKKPEKQQEEQEQDFPVFNIKDKKNQKNKQKNQKEIHANMVGWNNKQYVPNRWSEQQSLKNWAKRQQAQKVRLERQKQKQLQNKNFNQSKNQVKEQKKILTGEKKEQKKISTGERDYISKQQEQELDRAIKQSIKTKQRQQQGLQIIKSKKQNLIDQQQKNYNKKKKKKQTNNNSQIKQSQNFQANSKKEEVGIFEQIEKQEKLIKQKRQVEKQRKEKENNVQEVKKKQVKKIKMRFDDSSQEEGQKPKSKSILNDDDFAPIGSNNQKIKKQGQKKSIVNAISQANWKEQKQPEVKVKKNRKGKTEIIQKVNLF